MKKILCTLLVVVMCLTSAPLQGFVGMEWPKLLEINFSEFELPKIDFSSWFGSEASAATELAPTGQCGENVYWSYNENTGELVISGSGKMYDYNHDPINSCSPFINYDIKNLVVEYGVTSIGKSAFDKCTLINATLADSIVSIEEMAFNECTLKTVNFGSGLINIDINAFNSCLNITNITVSENNKFYSCDEYGVLFNKDKTMLIKYPVGNTRTTYNIPDSVKSIYLFAFEYAVKLVSIAIPDSVTTIDGVAFFHCDSLTSITVDKNNTAYSSDSRGVLFDKNKNLLIQYPIGNSATSYVIPDSVTTIGTEAFFGCSLTSVTIPDSVTTIGFMAFVDCTSLTSVTIPDSVTTIGDWAFGNCNSLTSVIIGDSVTTIGESTFGNCNSLTSVTIPDSVTTIGDWAFGNCNSLTSVTIPDSVTTIGDYAFYYCDSLESVTIPDSVTTIGYGAFDYCNNLYYVGSKEQWNDVTINGGNEPLLNSRIHFNYYQYTHDVYTSEVTKKATCTEYGIRTYTCHCGGGIYTENIPQIAHSYKGAITKAATCAEGGIRTYTCTCGANYTESIPKLTQHSDGDGNGYCDVCSGFVGVEKPSVFSTTYKGVTATLADDYFSGDSKVYNHDLAKFCSLFICVGYNYSDIELISETLEDVGMNADEDFIDTKVGQNGVNNIISHKKINVNGKEYTLIFVSAIGSYSKQWYSNFDPGTGTTHRGFTYAKNHVNLQLAKYIQKHKLHDVENTKILLTGHSRGAATVNLLAAELIKNQNFAKAENIYTYGFATPNTTSLSEKSEDRFKRIFNIVNPEDFVTKVLPTKWEFGRYGTTYTLPSNTNSDIIFANGKFTTEYLYKYLPNMKKVFKQLKSKEYDPYPNGEADVYWLMNKLTDKVSNLENYYSDNFRIDLLTKMSTFEVLQAVLCPIAAGDEEKTTDAYLLGGSILSSVSADGLYKDIVQFFIVNQGLSKHFEDSHFIETYCAYMMTMNENEIKEYRYPYAYKKHTVNCPVDIEVTDVEAGEVVGRIVNNIIDEEVAKSDIAIFMEVNGDSKTFYLPNNRDFDIKLTGNDVGTMDYTISEINENYEEISRVNFFDVEITDGLTMTADVEGEDFVIEEYELVYESGENLEPTEILDEEEITVYNVEITSTKGGFASTSQTAKSGDYVTLDAVAEEGWKFVGWYENSELISTETILAFVAKSDRSLEAKFEHIDHSFGDWYTVTPATCKETGTEKRECSECEYFETQGIPSNGHTNSAWITDKASTCSAEGSKHIECTVCKEVLKTEKISKLPHSYNAVTTQANCEAGGYTTYTCNYCDDSYVGDNTPANGHTFDGSACTSCGYDRADECDCACHASGIKAFFFKIKLFFWKLFKKNPLCECGAAHY